MVRSLLEVCGEVIPVKFGILLPRTTLSSSLQVAVMIRSKEQGPEGSLPKNTQQLDCKYDVNSAPDGLMLASFYQKTESELIRK